MFRIILIFAPSQHWLYTTAVTVHIFIQEWFLRVNNYPILSQKVTVLYLTSKKWQKKLEGVNLLHTIHGTIPFAVDQGGGGFDYV